MNDTGAKQQIVEKIKNSSNILVTVSSSPSVDELSAALGLTLLLNKLNKHTTAVFSGAVPPAITFLDPEKTFENTVDSLRDFIIALDKEKADHLRYKVDGEVVKIFITPYRTTLSSDDLDFSQGDYNVELVLAVGVQQRDNLDQALSAHGRILHDATVATISLGSGSQLGSIDWREENASSFSEMLVSISDALKKDKPVLDEQIATAFLTGLVAATDRFSNDKTSSRVMTMAAQLMAAGANQQLIAAKLEEAHEIGAGKDGKDNESDDDSDQNSDGTTNLPEGKSTKLKKNQSGRSRRKKSDNKQSDQKPVDEVDKNDGSLRISHEPKGDVDEVAAKKAEQEQQAAAAAAEAKLSQHTPPEEASAPAEPAEPTVDEQQAEEALSQQLSAVAPAASAETPSVADLQKDLAAANAEVEEAAANPEPIISKATQPATPQEPILGGTLNATTQQAADQARQAVESDRNRAILSHSKTPYVGDSKPTFDSPLNAANAPSDEPPAADPFAGGAGPSVVTQSSPKTIQPPTPAPEPEPTPAPVEPETALPPLPDQTLADLDRENRQADSHEEARQAVDAAFGAVPFTPAGNPASSVGAQPLGDNLQSNLPGASAAPVPDLPPLPDFSTLPPLPPAAPGIDPATPAPGNQAPAPALPPDKLEDMLSPAPQPPAGPPQPNDPAQFKIPGQ